MWSCPVSEQTQSSQTQSSCRALVPLVQRLAPSGGATRADAAFVTQILAHVLDMPSQRRARRAQPMSAVHIYSGAMSADPRFTMHVDRMF
jgi:hypothetical protein